MTSNRQYDLVLLGATGYTGKYAAEYLQEHAPTDLKWAIAGRNATKLSLIASDLQALSSDRKQPGVEVVQHEAHELDALAKKTKVLISTVGPFWKYGTPVVKACVENGTHYLDVTGEVPWVKDMIDQFHEKAKATKTVIIPQSGIDSVPSDLSSYILVKYIREKYNEGVGEVLSSIQSLNNTASGGTLLTALTLADAYPVKYLLASLRPWALSPIKPSPIQEKLRPGRKTSFLHYLTGYVPTRDLGLLTNSPADTLDRAIVHRSWGLFDSGKWYGSTFRFAARLRAKNAFAGIVTAYALLLLSALIALPPARWVMKKLVTQPGGGADKQTASKYFFKYRTVATSESGRRVAADLLIPGSAYLWTGIFVAEGALQVLKGDREDTLALREGGVLTPATLETGFVKRLVDAGLKFDVKDLER